MKCIKLIRYTLLLPVILVMLHACKDDMMLTTVVPMFEIAPFEVVVDGTLENSLPLSGKFAINASPNMRWIYKSATYSGTQGWIQLDTALVVNKIRTGSDSIKYIIKSENTDQLERSVKLTFHCYKFVNDSDSVIYRVVDYSIRQMGQAPYVFVQNAPKDNLYSVSRYGSNLSLSIRSNVKWSAKAYVGETGETPAGNWITFSEGSTGNKHGLLLPHIASNDLNVVKKGRIVLSSDDGLFKLEIKIEQEAMTDKKAIVILNMIDFLRNGDGKISLKNRVTSVITEHPVNIEVSNDATAIVFNEGVSSGSYDMVSITYTDNGEIRMIDGGVDIGTSNINNSERYDKDFKSFGGSADRPIKISTDADLRLLSTLVNAGNPMSGIYFKQMNNIDLSGADFIPIGTQTNLFIGNYDGQYFSINNIKILQTDATQKGAGLFGVTTGISRTNLQVFKNITIEGRNGSDYDIQANGGGVGSVAGVALDFVQFIHCKNHATMKASGGGIGGIVGHIGKLDALVPGIDPSSQIDTALIENCHNFAKIETYTATSYNTGGIVGNSCGAYIHRCSNRGELYSTEVSRRGGIAGYSNGIMTECFNKGNITGVGTIVYRLGGLVSFNGAIGKIINCYNTGDIHSNTTNVGGLIAVQKAANGNFRLHNCYALANIGTDAGNVNPKSGGIIGDASSSNTITLPNCLKNNFFAIPGAYSGPLIATNGGTVSGTMAKKIWAALYKAQSTYVEWDFINVWTIQEGVSAPTLRHNPE